jgi:hypothetical protein
MMLFKVHQPKGVPNQKVYFRPMKVVIIHLPFQPGMSMREQAQIAQRFNKSKSLIFTEYF